jgi:hypothetical protein
LSAAEVRREFSFLLQLVAEVLVGRAGATAEEVTEVGEVEVVVILQRPRSRGPSCWCFPGRGSFSLATVKADSVTSATTTKKSMPGFSLRSRGSALCVLCGQKLFISAE